MARTLTALEVQEYVAPEFDAIDLAVIEDVILEAVAFTNEAAWGSEKRYNTALKYLTLHLLTRFYQAQTGSSGGAGSGGSVSPGSVRWLQADGHQIGYGGAPGASASNSTGSVPAWYATTEWGFRYWMLSRTVFADRVL